MKVSLKSARVNANLTQRDVANHLGVSIDVIKKMESGKRELTVSEFYLLCDLYHCTYDDIILPINIT